MSPHYDLKDLTELNNCVDAHLESLCITENTSRDTCKNQASKIFIALLVPLPAMIKSA
jgi:hypothetical protein